MSVYGSPGGKDVLFAVAAMDDGNVVLHMRTEAPAGIESIGHAILTRTEAIQLAIVLKRAAEEGNA